MTQEEKKAIDDAIADRREKEEEIMRLEQEIRNIKAALTSTESEVGDWKVIKYYEYLASEKEAPYDMQELDIAREAERQRIRDITAEIEEKRKELPEVVIPDDYWDYVDPEEEQEEDSDSSIIE